MGRKTERFKVLVQLVVRFRVAKDWVLMAMLELAKGFQEVKRGFPSPEFG